MLHGFWKSAGKGKFVKQRQQLCTVVRLAATHAVVSLLASALVIPPALAAGLAARPDRVITAGTVTERDLSGALESVTTTTGTKLKLGFSATWSPGSSTGSFTVDLANSLTQPPLELHSWKFTVGKSSFTASGGGAKLTVTAKQIGWYGQLSLAFTPASHRAEPCATGSGVIYAGTVSGSIDFNTSQKPKQGWGSVDESKLSWPQSSLTVESGCEPPIHPAIAASR